MFNNINKCLDYLPQLTKDEADLIEMALRWSSETRTAFLLAKKMFEERKNEDKVDSDKPTNKRSKRPSQKSKANIKTADEAPRRAD